MEDIKTAKTASPAGHVSGRKSSWVPKTVALASLLCLAGLHYQPSALKWHNHCHHRYDAVAGNVYGRFPLPDDPFLFIPCTDKTLPPSLDETDPRGAWAQLYDPDPDHWSWGNASSSSAGAAGEDPYAGRGIYLCGYLEVPLDFTNQSDPRIVRLAVTKFQVAGLARLDGSSAPSAGHKSKRTIVVEPGGPGGSGTEYVWRAGEKITNRFSKGEFDILGWDPRGVNTTHPAISCFPYDADRDHWSLYAGQYRGASSLPGRQLEIADAMNAAIFHSCWETIGDLARFVSTTFVARDLEEIRIALGEDDLTAYMVSYGTGIGQTYANLFPDRVGRVILDGTEYVRDHRLLGGFGWTALDNVTNAWHDGFLGECVRAGPKHCALAKPIDGKPVVLDELQARMEMMVSSLIEQPMPAYTNFSGPSLITYSGLVGAIYGSLYNAESWPALALMLYELEAGNSTLAAAFLEHQAWEYDPTLPAPISKPPSSDELGSLVICADSYDAPLPPDGLAWWDSLWDDMTNKSWISGNSRFSNVFPCRHFTKYWPEPAGVYRGDLNHTLKHPVLLIAETYDPATPLRNGRRLLEEMGPNARLIAHHGYGHSSRDTSNCTDSIGMNFILHGTLPDEQETACYANEKPYLYGAQADGVSSMSSGQWDPITMWQRHLEELAVLNPRLLP